MDLVLLVLEAEVIKFYVSYMMWAEVRYLVIAYAAATNMTNNTSNIKKSKDT